VIATPPRLAPLDPRREWIPPARWALPALSPLFLAAAKVPETGQFPRASALSVLVSGHRSAGGAPLSFEAQTKKTKVRALAEAYDARIFFEGRIPTREGSFHDYFNALVWGTFTRAKIAVNERQYRALAEVFTREGCMPGARTREQDALAMLDEGGLLLATDHEGRGALDEALARGEGETVCALVAANRVRALVFGHALAEHMVSDSTVVRGLPVPVLVPTECLSDRLDRVGLTSLIAAVDAALERALRRDFARLAGAPGAASLLALPIVPSLFAGFEGALSA
jgi:hypothetical protein